MKNLTGGSVANSKTGRTVVRSVTVTATSGDEAELKLYDYRYESEDPKLMVRALNGETINIHFQGLEFPGGVLVVPDVYTACFVIEYDE